MQHHTVWRTTRFEIDLMRPLVMGIVNVTPDSFSDGGHYFDSTAALAHCEKLLADGADILDIGGESTRPGAASIPLDEELKRVLPVLRHAVELNVPVSVDTSKPEVMRVALDLGVDIVNDIYGLRKSGALEVLASHPACGVCVMHMRGDPGSMQQQLESGCVIQMVRSFLADRLQMLDMNGIDRARVVIDPGVGFGKSVEDNFELLRRQAELLDLGQPLLVGWSRKSSLGAVTGQPANRRDAISVVAAIAAIQLGANIVRVHDVADTVAALKVWDLAGLPTVVGLDEAEQMGRIEENKQ